MTGMRATVAAQIGKKYGPYEILGNLGGGGMGFVYKAWDARLHREVAIKLLHNEYTMPGMRERFLREARAASALNHPNICTIFDIGEQNGEPYLVMELLEGQTLKDLIDYRNPTVDEVLQVAREGAEALGAAHAKGVIHRDIKPANIFLVDKPNGTTQAKVLDFGLAKFQGGVLGARSNRAADLTAVGATVGTLAYMSPEQARGETLDSRSDLFSLGVVLYEMATRQIPFPGATSALVFVQLLNHHPESVRNWNDSIPKELDRIIFKLMAKERTQRFQTAHELEDALARVGEKGGGWLRKAVPSVPTGRGPERNADPVARDRRVRKPDSQLDASRAASTAAEASFVAPPARNSPAPAVPRVGGEEPSHLRPAARVGRPDSEAGSPVALDSSSETPSVHASGADSDPAITDSGEYAASLPDAFEDRILGRPEREAARIPRSRFGPLQIGLGCAVLAIMMLAILFKRGHFRGAILSDQDTVVLTEIENRTGDKALDGVVDTGLHFALAESPYLRLDSESSYLAARRQVDAASAGAPGHAIARNTAQKLRAKAYLFGQITGSAPPYAIHLDLLETSSNDILSTVEEPLPSLDQLPAVMDRVATTLRGNLGESSESVNKFSIPLANEATGNPEALRAFRQGEDAYVAGRTLEALQFYQQAVTLEPKFVQAHLQLVVLYRTLRAELAAGEAAKLALASTDGSSPRTKALAQYEFEMNATGDYPFAVSILRQFSGAHPHDADVLEKLAQALRLEGRIAESLQTAEEATREDPYNQAAWVQTENALIGLDRYDAAAQADMQAQRLGLPEVGGALSAAYLGGREEVLASAIAQSQSQSQNQKGGFRPDWSYGIYLDNVGHMGAGGELWHSRAAEAMAIPNLQSAGAFLLAQSAYDRALLGDCPAALAFGKEADLHPEGMTALFNVGMADALCGNSARALELAAELQKTYPQSFEVRGFYVADIKAGIALQEQNPSVALELLKTAQQYDVISLTPLLRGRAHVALHQVQIGIVDFQTVLAHRGVPFIVGNVSYPVAQIGVARAFADTGDLGNSANAYRRFLELWKTADAGQPLVAEARAHSR